MHAMSMEITVIPTSVHIIIKLTILILDGNFVDNIVT